MQTYSAPAIPTSSLAPRLRARTAVLASSDSSFRRRLGETLSGLRWQVREVETGAQAWAETESSDPEALIVDSWLPDLDLGEFVKEFRASFPKVDLMTAEGMSVGDGPRGPHRQELLYALRKSQDGDTAAWNATSAMITPTLLETRPDRLMGQSVPHNPERVAEPSADFHTTSKSDEGLKTSRPFESAVAENSRSASKQPSASERLPELVGNAPVMLEVSRRIRLVAPRSTPVLIEGPTGSGKELVAEALHRLSTRSRKPFVAINCAAIPEALLEAELFGHTRGAFTGAVQGRVGRIESADGGTLFLDEIGEMPLALQAKLLRFVESGELQRVGDNDTVKVDVRIVAATHRPLAAHTQDGRFRADLYYRLAVFLIRTPALADHPADLPLLVAHFLEKMGREEPVKCLDAGAMTRLQAHQWPGNVRELEHVLERAAILAGDSAFITAREIDFGTMVN
jgi:DNA-binding NtrC family response regulator